MKKKYNEDKKLQLCNFYIRKELYSKIKEVASHFGLGVSGYIRYLIINNIEKIEKVEK